MRIPPLRILIINIAAYSILFTGGVLVFSNSFNALSCLAGASLMGGNLLLLYWAWQRIFNKKTIALAAGVIVSKYAILGIIIYYVITFNVVDVVSFLIGCGSLLPILITMSVQYNNTYVKHVT